MNLFSQAIKLFKKYAYFIVAAYFKYWATLFLQRWKPTIITVIGSSGKTTLLHLFKAQLGARALYSEKANSAFGIPFHILGLERKSFSLFEWPLFVIYAPFKVLRRIPSEHLYVTEADAERPGEGKFLADLLKPDFLVWLSLDEAHGINYEKLIKKTIDNKSTDNQQVLLEELKKGMAAEFGNFIKVTTKLIVIDKDNSYIMAETLNVKNKNVVGISKKEITAFNIHQNSVEITTNQEIIQIPQLIPTAAAVSIIAVEHVLSFLKISSDKHYTHFVLPPGRSSVFKGIKHTTLIDSSYNATIDGMRAMLDVMTHYPASGEKWLVLGDMIEQGTSESIEHSQLAQYIREVQPARLILVGPRLIKYTYPALIKNSSSESMSMLPSMIATYTMPGDALQYLQKELKGGETILFKGARFLEGIVEKLLQDPTDVSKLCRREAVWMRRRKYWGV